MNNAIQWTKDQAKEEIKQRATEAELLSKAKEHVQGTSSGDSPSENASLLEPGPRASTQLTRLQSASKSGSKLTSTGGSIVEEDETDRDTRAGISVMHDEEDDDDFADLEAELEAELQAEGEGG